MYHHFVYPLYNMSLMYTVISLQIVCVFAGNMPLIYVLTVDMSLDLRCCC